ncbi:MAG: putative transposase [Verrucomicrobiales bacterium]|jgi:putative transposase
MGIHADSLFTSKFAEILKRGGVTLIKLLPRSPNLNAFAERFVRSVKEQWLERMMFFSERQLRTVVSESAEYYDRERNHPRPANRLIERSSPRWARLPPLRTNRSFRCC